MKTLQRIIGLLALATLIVGISTLITGSRLSDERERQRSLEAFYGRQLRNELPFVGRIAGILVRAGQREQARRLEDFFAYCNVQRFFGDETVCTAETVGSAMYKASELLTVASGLPVDTPQLTDQLAHSLTFSLPGVALLQKSTDPLRWSRLHYDGPGVLRYQSLPAGAYIFISALNNSTWDITGFRARVNLQVQGIGTIQLDCDSRLFEPFLGLDVLHPSQETIASCHHPPNIELDQLVTVLHTTALAVQLQELTLREPRVVVTDGGEMASSRFMVHPILDVPLEPPSPGSPDLVNGNCGPTGHCLPARTGPSLALYDVFHNQLVLVPICCGVLLGLAIGGLAKRPGVVGAIAAGIVLLVMISFLVYCWIVVPGEDPVHHNDYLGLALIYLTWIAVAGYAMLVAALYVGIGVVVGIFKLAQL